MSDTPSPRHPPEGLCGGDAGQQSDSAYFAPLTAEEVRSCMSYTDSQFSALDIQALHDSIAALGTSHVAYSDDRSPPLLAKTAEDSQSMAEVLPSLPEARSPSPRNDGSGATLHGLWDVGRLSALDAEFDTTRATFHSMEATEGGGELDDSDSIISEFIDFSGSCRSQRSESPESEPRKSEPPVTEQAPSVPRQRRTINIRPNKYKIRPGATERETLSLWKQRTPFSTKDKMTAKVMKAVAKRTSISGGSWARYIEDGKAHKNVRKLVDSLYEQLDRKFPDDPSEINKLIFTVTDVKDRIYLQAKEQYMTNGKPQKRRLRLVEQSYGSKCKLFPASSQDQPSDSDSLTSDRQDTEK